MKPEYELILSVCKIACAAMISTATDQSLVRVKLKAIQDRINGVFDSKELIPYGPLSDDTTTRSKPEI